MDPSLPAKIAASTHEIFSTMVMMDVTSQEPRRQGVNTLTNSVTGMVGIAGARKGMLAIHVPNGLAMAITSSFLGMDVTDISEDVQDAVGEMANMLGGNVKALLSESGSDIQLSLPSIVFGEEYSFQQHSDHDVICIPFSSASGDFTVELQMSRS